MIGMKLWDCTDEEKWKHIKFEDMKVQETFNKGFLHSHLKFSYMLNTNSFTFSDTLVPESGEW